MYNPYNPSIELEDMIRGFKAVISNQENYLDTINAMKYEMVKRYKQVLIKQVAPKSLTKNKELKAIDTLFDEDGNFSAKDLFEFNIQKDVDVSAVVVSFNLIDSTFASSIAFLMEKTNIDPDDYEPILSIIREKNYIDLFEIRFMDNTLKVSDDKEPSQLLYYIEKFDTDLQELVNNTNDAMIKATEDIELVIDGKGSIINRLRYKYNLFGYKEKALATLKLKDEYMENSEKMIKEWRDAYEIIKIAVSLINKSVINKFLSEYKYDLERIFNSQFEIVR